MRTLCDLFLLIVLCTGFHVGSAEETLPASGGKTDYRIVITANAAPAEKYAAEELQSFFRQSTGAELAISDDATAPA